jgi:hypothetical protein
MGTSQVSASTKIVKATCYGGAPPMIFLVNRIDEKGPAVLYRLAIITMQMMPKISCPQRVASDTRTRDVAVCEIALILPSFFCWTCVCRSARGAAAGAFAGRCVCTVCGGQIGSAQFRSGG